MFSSTHVGRKASGWKVHVTAALLFSHSLHSDLPRMQRVRQQQGSERGRTMGEGKVAMASLGLRIADCPLPLRVCGGYRI